MTTEHRYLTLMEAVAFGLQEGNETLLPFDFVTSIGKAFDTPLISIKGFDIENYPGFLKINSILSFSDKSFFTSTLSFGNIFLTNSINISFC